MVVVVGGGGVAARKARGAIAAGAKVRIVAPKLSDELPGEAQRISERYAAHHLAQARLVFAATDDRLVNDAVVRDAKAAGILVNRADGEDGDRVEKAAEAGNFIVPAQFNKSGVIVSVAAGSAAVSVAIRDGLAERFNPEWARLAVVVRTLRPLVRTSGLAPSRRAKILRELAGREVIALLQENEKNQNASKDESPVTGEQAVREWLLRRLAEARDESE